MNSIFDALTRAFRDLFRLEVLWNVVWPLIVAIMFWTIVGMAFWDTFSVWIIKGLDSLGLQPWLEGIQPYWIANLIQTFFHLIMFVPMVFITSLLITAIFAMPSLIRLVAERHFPGLRREEGGSIYGNILNASIAIALFIAIWLLTWPLWFLGLGLVVPFIASAYLNQRLFRYDALAEHACRDEMVTLFSNYQSSWWGLGLLTGLLQFVPFLNLFAPVFTAIAFIHFGLGRLAELRDEPYRTINL